jgi:hypothetical protein
MLASGGGGCGKIFSRQITRKTWPKPVFFYQSVKFSVFSPKSEKLRFGNFKLPQSSKNDEKLPR